MFCGLHIVNGVKSPPFGEVGGVGFERKVYMASKYTPLEKYLRDLPASQREVTMSFEQIETIIKSKLPASANEMSWWEHATEGNHVNKRVWSNAGWRVGTVHLQGKWVRFVRG